ncbi:MAG TPA: hypothetical protein VLN48_22030 [Bryobacteraceae bacterium]|nr:hypothetical protein [Bryobacteraceae bacterium]
MTDKQHIVELLDRLEPSQIAAVVQLLEVIVHEDDDKLTDEDRRAVAASREYFHKGGAGIPFEQLVADLGLTMDQIRNHKSE